MPICQTCKYDHCENVENTSVELLSDVKDGIYYATWWDKRDNRVTIVERVGTYKEYKTTKVIFKNWVERYAQ